MDILPSSDKNLKQTPLLIFANVIICDIEGTTTSINFVKEVLFEYASSHVKKFLKRNWKEKPVKKVVLDLISECGDDLKNNSKGAINLTDDDFDKKERKDKIKMIAKSVKWLIKKDRKVASLKTLQGMIWKEGFVNGILKGHIYDDVPIAFEKWVDVGAKIYIYSSGSEHAQKLLYTYSKFGNLLPKISGHFDIGIGMKNESNSYKNILTKIGVNAKYVLFLTDSVQEARAAKKADISVILLDRPGNADYTDEIRSEFKIIKAFDNIEILNYKKEMKKYGQKLEEGNKNENRETDKLVLEKQAEENAVEEKLIEENVMEQVEKGEINFDEEINGDAMKQIAEQNQTKNILKLEENKELLKDEREEKRREKKAHKKMKAGKKKAEKREERHLKKEEKKKKKKENNKLEIKQEENLPEWPEVMMDEANIGMQDTQIQDEKVKNEMVVENKEQKEGDIEEETRGEGKSKNKKKKEVKIIESEIIKENKKQEEEWKETNNMNQSEKSKKETEIREWKENKLVKDPELEEIHYELANKDAEENLQQKEQKIKGKKNKKKKKVKDQMENKTEQDVEMEDLTIK